MKYLPIMKYGKSMRETQSESQKIAWKTSTKDRENITKKLFFSAVFCLIVTALISKSARNCVHLDDARDYRFI